jgi:hypothetical protein
MRPLCGRDVQPYRITLKPHKISIPIDTTMQLFNIPDLHSAISFFHNNGISGAFPHHDEYSRASLPYIFENLDIWTHMKITLSPPNEFYAPEQRKLHCKPEKNGSKPVYDPILVRITRPRTGTTHMSTLFVSTECHASFS